MSEWLRSLLTALALFIFLSALGLVFVLTDHPSKQKAVTNEHLNAVLIPCTGEGR